MKIIKYFLYAILFLVVVFFAIGLLKPSISYGHEITVNKSVKEAWAVASDETKYGEWLKGYISSELLSGDEQAVGSKYKVIVNPGEGQDNFEMTQSITDMKEFEWVKMNFDSDFMEMDQTITYDEKDGKTTVTSDNVVRGKGIMGRAMFAIMEMLGGAFTKQETMNMEGLKKVIEANTTDYYPAPVEKLEEVMEDDALEGLKSSEKN